MSYEVMECSPKARSKIKSFEDALGVDAELTHHRSKYPWPLLKIGQSFAVRLSEGNEASLRNGASQFSKKTGKKFAVIRHSEYGWFECVRIA